jgi:hypothetical protein
LRGGICIGLLHMLVLRKAIEQSGAQNAPRFFRQKMQKSYDFWRKYAGNQRRNESFSHFHAENSQNGNFRRTQNARFRNEDEKPSVEVGIREG